MRLAAPGRHNVMNALAAAATAWSLGQGADAVAAAWRPSPGGRTPGPPGGPRRPGGGGRQLQRQPRLGGLGPQRGEGHGQGRPLVLVLGDMKELGGYAPAMHRDMGRLAAQEGFRLVLALGEQASAVPRGPARAACRRIRPWSSRPWKSFWRRSRNCWTLATWSW